MRGKSIDTEFVASFIQNCANNNKTTPAEICEEAIRQIATIDEQLKLRTKLTDVLSHFSYKKKISEAKKEVISFNKINRSMSNNIISLLGEQGTPVNDILNELAKFNDNYKQDIIFTFKQLLETKVLSRTSQNTIVRGELFNEFNESKVQ